MSTEKLLIATVSGIVVGAAVALLTAPASGSETRKKIGDGTQKLKNKIQSLVGKASNELDELTKIMETQTEGLSEDVRKRALKLITAAKASYSNVAEEAGA